MPALSGLAGSAASFIRPIGSYRDAALSGSSKTCPHALGRSLTRIVIAILLSFGNQGGSRFPSRPDDARPAHRSNQESSTFSDLHTRFPGRKAKRY